MRGYIVNHNHDDQTTTIRVPTEVAKALEDIAARKGLTISLASKVLIEGSTVRELLEVAIYTAAYAGVVAEELALRGLDPDREKTQISDTRRAYRKATYERVTLFKRLLGEKNA